MACLYYNESIRKTADGRLADAVYRGGGKMVIWL